MSFTTLAFWLFLPVVFALHWAARNRRWRNGVLLAASYVFYGWWDWRFCGLMLASSLIDYAGGLAVDVETNARRRHAWLVLTLTANLAILGFFKYFNFFADSLVVALTLVGLDLEPTTLKVVLPVGISFYTFQTMSYTVDIYRREISACRSVLDYLTFVSFFPQLVAGPIERAGALLAQFRGERVFDPDDARAGCRFILWGLAKKLVLADNLAPLVEAAYASPTSASAAQLALGTVAFAFQIYCDFSAYSDIAIGTARLFNVRLQRNFATPYFAQSVTEFWRRWHQSLSSWLRDYVFIPLGGSRGPIGRTSRNLALTALISGLWHGAAWHFVVWGAMHGLCLVAERFQRRNCLTWTLPAVAGGESNWPGLVTLWRIARTFLIVCATWVLFRADSLGDAAQVYVRVGSGVVTAAFWSEGASLVAGDAALWSGVVALVAAEWFSRREWHPLVRLPSVAVVRWVIYTGLVWLILVAGAERTSEFIYFQF